MLQLAQRKFIRHQLESNRTGLQFVAQAVRGIIQDLGVIKGQLGHSLHREPAYLGGVAARLPLVQAIAGQQSEISHADHPPARVAPGSP